MARSLPADLMLGHPFSVYKMFDVADATLYVGRTENLWARFRAHSKSSEWWPRVKRYEIEFFDSFGEAFNAERARILELQPIYNVARFEPLDEDPVGQELVKTGTAGRQVGVPHSTLRDAAKKGWLKPTSITPGGHYLWNVAELKLQLLGLRQ